MPVSSEGAVGVAYPRDEIDHRGFGTCFEGANPFLEHCVFHIRHIRGSSVMMKIVSRRSEIMYVAETKICH